jgi:hypothetical protein
MKRGSGVGWVGGGVRQGDMAVDGREKYGKGMEMVRRRGKQAARARARERERESWKGMGEKGIDKEREH